MCGPGKEECLCPDCGDVLKSKSLLAFHISYKHRVHKCKECAKEFVGANALAVHKRAEHGNFQCDQCDKVMKAECGVAGYGALLCSMLCTSMKR